MFDFKKPRSLAFATLLPHESVKITVDPPLTVDEGFRIFSLAQGVKGAIKIESQSASTIVIRNSADVEVPYIFVVLPLQYLRVIEADWSSLALFLKSLQKHVPGWLPAMPTKPTSPA
jgi:hypothetical protein